MELKDKLTFLQCKEVAMVDMKYGKHYAIIDGFFVEPNNITEEQPIRRMYGNSVKKISKDEYIIKIEQPETNSPYGVSILERIKEKGDILKAYNLLPNNN